MVRAPLPPLPGPKIKANFEPEYTRYVLETAKRFDLNNSGALGYREASLATRILVQEGDINMARIFNVFAKRLKERDANDNVFNDGVLTYIPQFQGEHSEIYQIAALQGRASVFSAADLNTPNPVQNVPFDEFEGLF